MKKYKNFLKMWACAELSYKRTVMSLDLSTYSSLATHDGPPHNMLNKYLLGILQNL